MKTRYKIVISDLQTNEKYNFDRFRTYNTGTRIIVTHDVGKRYDSLESAAIDAEKVRMFYRSPCKVEIIRIIK